MEIRASVFLAVDSSVQADPESLTLDLGELYSNERLVLFLGSGVPITARPEAAAAIADRMIEELQKIRDAALAKAVREGDKAEANEVDAYVRSLGRPPLQVVDKILDEETRNDRELMRDEFHGRGIDGSL